MKLKDKVVLLTGGAGFIGSHLADALIREGCCVRVIDNLSTGKLKNLNQHAKNNRFNFILGSITNPRILDRAMKGVDIVFHLACRGVRHSIIYPFENHKVNAEGTLMLLEQARKNKVKKFIYSSSSEIYGTARFVPMPESHPEFPCTVYGASKLAGEAYTRAYFETYRLKTVVVRPFNTYGPRSHHEGDAGEMIPKSIVRALNSRPVLIFGDGSQTRDFTYVEDIALGFIRAAECDDTIGQTLNMGSNFEIAIKDIAAKIIKIIGQDTKIKHLKNRPGDVMRLYADSTKFMKLTHWRPKISLKEGLIRTVNWFKSRPESAQALLKEEKGINWK